MIRWPVMYISSRPLWDTIRQPKPSDIEHAGYSLVVTDLLIFDVPSVACDS